MSFLYATKHIIQRNTSNIINNSHCFRCKHVLKLFYIKLYKRHDFSKKQNSNQVNPLQYFLKRISTISVIDSNIETLVKSVPIIENSIK